MAVVHAGTDFHDCGDGLSDPLGRGLDVAIPEMGVAQGHAHVGVAEKPGDHGNRHAVHHRVAGMRMTEVVEADVLDAGFPPDTVPEPEVGAARPCGVERRRKDERAAVPRLAFEDAPGLAVEGNPSRPCLALAGTSGSARGALGNQRPYRDQWIASGDPTTERLSSPAHGHWYLGPMPDRGVLDRLQCATPRAPALPIDASGAELCRRIEVPVSRMTEMLNGRGAATDDTVLHPGRFFGTSGEFRLNLHKLYELWHAEQRKGAAIARRRSLGDGDWPRG